MNKNQDMKNMKEKLQTITPPPEVDLAIERGMAKGRCQRKYKKVVWRSTLTAAAMFILLVTSIRVSPTFASALSEIPLLNKLVEIVSHDDNLLAAIDNDFFVPVDATTNAHGIMIDVEGVIADDSRLVVFYSIIDRGAEKREGEIKGIRVVDESGKEFESAFSYWGKYDFNEKDTWREKIEFSFPPEATKLPEKLFISLDFPHGGSENSNKEFPWELEIDIPHDTFANLAEEIQVNQVVSIENQRVYIHDVIVYPTKTAVIYEIAKDNNYDVYEMSDIKLVDGKGKEWSRISQGTTGWGPNEDGRYVLYLDSPYFDGDLEELYLEGSKLSALPVEEATVIVDTEEEKVVKAPKNMIIDELTVTSRIVGFTYTIENIMDKTVVEKYINVLGLFHSQEIINQDGDKITSSSSSYRTMDNDPTGNSISFQETYQFEETIKDRYLHFHFQSYPNYLEQPWRIKLK